MEDCIFCKIGEGKVPKEKIILEDEEFIAFLDIKPYVIGHMLIIPKKHSRWLWEMSLEDYRKLMDMVYHLARVLGKAFDTDWVEEVVAGGGVSHTHVHLLPRKEGDGFGEVPTKPLELVPSDDEMNDIAEKIKKHMDIF